MECSRGEQAYLKSKLYPSLTPSAFLPFLVLEIYYITHPGVFFSCVTTYRESYFVAAHPLLPQTIAIGHW